MFIDIEWIDCGILIFNIVLIKYYVVKMKNYNYKYLNG